MGGLLRDLVWLFVQLQDCHERTPQGQPYGGPIYVFRWASELPICKVFLQKTLTRPNGRPGSAGGGRWEHYSSSLRTAINAPHRASPAGAPFMFFDGQVNCPSVRFFFKKRLHGLTAAPALPGARRWEHYSSSFRTAMNASVGSWTLPRFRIFFLPSFCFSKSFFLREISPP